MIYLQNKQSEFNLQFIFKKGVNFESLAKTKPFYELVPSNIFEWD